MLELDLATIAFEIVNFLLLSLLLYRFVLQPVLRRVQERAAEKEQLLREMTAEREAAVALKASWEARLEQAEAAAADIISQAEVKAREQSTKLQEEAYAEAEQILERAQRETGHWREQALAEFHDDLVETVLDVSAQLMAQAAPPTLHDALVQQVCDRIWQMGRQEMQKVDTIRRALRDREPTVYVSTARPLTSEQQGQLIRTFTALVDRNVNLELTTAADLVAGLHIRLGDLVVENAITGQLTALREQVTEVLAQYRSAQKAVPGVNGRG